jgi:HPt (histidine-containing phosphotransfer) domain-containing protein
MTPDQDKLTPFPMSLLFSSGGPSARDLRAAPVAELASHEELSGDDSADHAPLNFEDLQRRCMGRIEFAERLLASFEKRFPAELLEIAQCLADEDVPRLARLAHQLNGTTANICAPALQQIMQKIEATVKSGQLAETRRWLARLEVEWERFTDYRAKIGGREDKNN